MASRSTRLSLAVCLPVTVPAMALLPITTGTLTITTGLPWPVASG